MDLFERSRCSAPDCSNAVELTAKGHERRFCRRHRPAPLTVGPPQPGARMDSEARAPAAERSGSTRRAIGQVLNEEEVAQKIRDLIDRIMELTGVEWGFCPYCKKKVQVQVADLKGRVDALIKLLEQAEGKPGTVSADAGLTLIVERTWPTLVNPTI